MPLPLKTKPKPQQNNAAVAARLDKLRDIHEMMQDQIRDAESMKQYKLASSIRSKELSRLLGELQIETEEYGGVRATRYSRTGASKINAKKLLKKGVSVAVIEACTDQGKTSYPVKITRINDADDEDDNEDED